VQMESLDLSYIVKSPRLPFDESAGAVEFSDSLQFTVR